MHFLLYVCVPTGEAKTSLQARRRAIRYLNDEHFVHSGRFCGMCDYFSVGGRYSGMLNMLRLKQQHPRLFKQFRTRYLRAQTAQERSGLFKRCFPKYEEWNPTHRPQADFYGCPDDAQIMDEALFAELKGGFNEYVSFAVSYEKPNVIFTDLGEDEWLTNGATGVGRHWVVVIDYHD